MSACAYHFTLHEPIKQHPNHEHITVCAQSHSAMWVGGLFLAGVQVCSSCRLTKPSTEFYTNKTAADMLHSLCKTCHGDKCRSRASGNYEVSVVDKVCAGSYILPVLTQYDEMHPLLCIAVSLTMHFTTTSIADNCFQAACQVCSAACDRSRIAALRPGMAS